MKDLFVALAAAMAMGVAADAAAQISCYTYTDDEGFPIYGPLRRVSPNGLWATGGDEVDETGAFVINTSQPEILMHTPNGYLLDIDNNGMAVGSWYEEEGFAKYKRAAIYRDGEWKQLPLPSQIIGQSAAVAISSDSKVIAGHGLCRSQDPTAPGRYFPIVWRLDESTGEYRVDRLYNHLYLPGAYGFFVYDMTPDARYICGIQSLDFSDTIGVILDVASGELITFNNIEIKDWEFEGIGTFKQMFVDGVMDGLLDTPFGGSFLYATNRFLFGSHTVVTDAQPDGTGTVTNYAAVYDLYNEEFVLGEVGSMYLCGEGPEAVFTNSGELIVNGHSDHLQHIVGAGNPINGVYGFDDSGCVWAGAYVTYNTIGEIIESPVLVILDEPLFAGMDVAKEISSQIGATVKVSGNTITVTGASDVAVYTIEGNLVSRSATTVVAPGMYIVVADRKASKIIAR